MKSLDTFVEEARSHLDRVALSDLDNEIAAGALLVDIRPADQRERDGDLPGAMVIDRNVLEWRLSPSSEARIVDVQPGQRVILVCNEGYQSTLAAVALREFGVAGATDLIGGYQAYLAARPGAGRKRLRSVVSSTIASCLTATSRKLSVLRRPGR